MRGKRATRIRPCVDKIKRRRRRRSRESKRGVERKEMAEKKLGDLDARWDACVDLTLRRVCYASFAGAFGGLLLLRSPVTRWASVAFGAGIGIGSAYTECSQKFGGSLTKWTPASEASLAPASQDEHE